MDKLRRYALTLVVFAATLGSSAKAQPTVVCTTSPIVFGNEARFELQGGYMGWTQGMTKWQYKWTVGSCNPGFKPDSTTGNAVSYYLQYPGSLQVQCNVEYNNGSGGQKNSFSPSTTITVPPSDGIRILSGDKVSKPFGQANPTLFQVTCGPTDSIYFDCFAQERITKFKYLTSGKTLPDMDWVPTTKGGAGSNAFTYTSSTGKISDQKAFPRIPFILGLPANTPLMSLHQDIQISIVDPCGNLMAPIKLGKGFDVTETKDTQDQNGGSYIISHNPTQ